MRARDEKYNFILFISYFLLLLQHEVFRGTQTKNLQTIEIKQKTNIMKYPIGIQNFGEIRRGGYVYVDKTPQMWKWKVKVTNLDMRHLIWNIAKRMGMENGYGTKVCGRFVMMMFPELCIKRNESRCSDDYLANNLTAEENKGFIKIDIPDPHSIAFHIRDEHMKQAV
jgi:hypothetical protein